MLKNGPKSMIALSTKARNTPRSLTYGKRNKKNILANIKSGDSAKNANRMKPKGTKPSIFHLYHIPTVWQVAHNYIYFHHSLYLLPQYPGLFNLRSPFNSFPVVKAQVRSSASFNCALTLQYTAYFAVLQRQLF